MLKIVLLFWVLQIRMSMSSLVIDQLGQNGLHYNQYCPKMNFCPEGAHVMCMYFNPNQTTAAGPKCNGFMNMSISVEIAEKLVDLVNEIRGRAAMGYETGKNDIMLPRAYGLYKLKWDNELATFAQVLANTCTFKKDICRATKKFPDPGQLVSAVRFSIPDWFPVDHPMKFTQQGLNKDKVEYAIKEGFKAWYTMKQQITPDVIEKVPDSYRHLKEPTIGKKIAEQLRYLQLVYGSVTHMGCGLSAYVEYVYIPPNQITTKKNICNTVHIVCNFSAKPKKGTAVYKTVNPYENPADGHFSKCGCPEGTVEDDMCLCSENPANTRKLDENCDNASCKPSVVLLPVFTMDDTQGALNRSGSEELVRQNFMERAADVVKNHISSANDVRSVDQPAFRLGYFNQDHGRKRPEIMMSEELREPTKSQLPEPKVTNEGHPPYKLGYFQDNSQPGKKTYERMPGNRIGLTNDQQPKTKDKNDGPTPYRLGYFKDNTLSGPKQLGTGIDPTGEHHTYVAKSVGAPYTSKRIPFAMKQVKKTNTALPPTLTRSASSVPATLKLGEIGYKTPGSVNSRRWNMQQTPNSQYPTFTREKQRKESIFARMPKFSLPHHETKSKIVQTYYGSKPRGPKKIVVPRKDFSKAQQLVNSYLRQKNEQPFSSLNTKLNRRKSKSRRKFNSFQSTISPDILEFLNQTLFSTPEDPDRKEASFDSNDDLTDHQNTEDVTTLNEKFDNRLMILLDTLEQEVKNIEMGANEKEFFDAKIRKIYGAAVGKEPEFTNIAKENKNYRSKAESDTDVSFNVDIIEDPNKKSIDKEMYDNEDKVQELHSDERKQLTHLKRRRNFKTKNPMDFLNKIKTKVETKKSPNKGLEYRRKFDRRIEPKTKRKDRIKTNNIHRGDVIEKRSKYKNKPKQKKNRDEFQKRVARTRNHYYGDRIEHLNKMDAYRSKYDDPERNYPSDDEEYESKKSNYRHGKDKMKMLSDYDDDLDLGLERRKYYQEKLDKLEKSLSSRRNDHEKVRARRLMHGRDDEESFRPFESDTPPYYLPDRADRARFISRY